MFRLFFRMITIAAFAVALCTAMPAVAGQQEARLIAMINQDRAAKGRKPLEISPKLMAAAEAHARDMVAKGYFSHTGKDGSTLGKRIRRQGYKFCYAAENIAFGQKTATGAMTSWRASAGHRKNNLSRKPSQIGAGFAGRKMWVLVFARPC